MNLKWVWWECPDCPAVTCTNGQRPTLCEHCRTPGENLTRWEL